MVLVKNLDIIFSLIENASHDCMEMEITSFKTNVDLTIRQLDLLDHFLATTM